MRIASILASPHVYFISKPQLSVPLLLLGYSSVYKIALKPLCYPFQVEQIINLLAMHTLNRREWSLRQPNSIRSPLAALRRSSPRALSHVAPVSFGGVSRRVGSCWGCPVPMWGHRRAARLPKLVLPLIPHFQWACLCSHRVTSPRWPGITARSEKMRKMVLQ